MSNRCLISLRKNVQDQDSRFDYIYDEFGTVEDLKKEWLFAKPFQLVIRDVELYPKFLKDMYGDEIRYDPDGMFADIRIFIEHYKPETLDELTTIIDTMIKEKAKNTMHWM